MNKKRVFIVDDALDYRTLLSVTLKDAGFKVYMAKDGIEAYVKFFKVKPDIVLVDILLPKMRGDVLIRWLKGTVPGRQVPFIVTSMHTPMKEYLYQLGIELFLEKPFKSKAVIETVKEILEIYESKKVLADRVFQLKMKFDKSEVKELISHKVCEVCHATMPAEAMRCPMCDSVRVHILK